MIRRSGGYRFFARGWATVPTLDQVLDFLGSYDKITTSTIATNFMAKKPDRLFDLKVEKSFQTHCTKMLSYYLSLPKDQSRSEWNEERKELASFNRVIIADVDYTDSDLSDLSFPYIYFIRVNFAGANLSNCNFQQSMIVDCDFTGANLIGANFDRASLKSVVMRNVRYDNITNFSFQKSDLPGSIDLTIRESAENKWRLQEISNNKSNTFFYNKLLWVLGYGASFRRVMMLSSVVICFFDLTFRISLPVERCEPDNISPTILNSVRYFFAISDPYEKCFWTSMLGLTESAVGAVTLAFLVAVFLRKTFLLK